MRTGSQREFSGARVPEAMALLPSFECYSGGGVNWLFRKVMVILYSWGSARCGVHGHCGIFLGSAPKLGKGEIEVLKCWKV